MKKTLRPYQQEALTKLRQRLKQTTDPLLVNASVGAGKSLILSELLLGLERSGYRALCLTLNSTLIQQNADTYQLQGGNASIYCSGLKSKAFEECVIFASPHSICQGIKNKNRISQQPFKLIIVDECHNINPHDNSSMYMRILNHYGLMAQQEQYSFRVVGLTGTPYRGKALSIIGPDQYFKEEVCNISSSWLIEQGYLVRPEFGIRQEAAYDFSQLRVNNMGKFNGAELAAIVDANERLTGQIMRELTEIMQARKGVFIFAATRKHCLECAKSLPDGELAIVTGETPHEERKEILQKGREGLLRFLISVGCLNVGVDIPLFDTVAWLRPTESLVLYTQGIGRVLRLHPGKFRALVLDYAGNLDRHGDIDDPIINEALKPNETNQQEYIIPCYTCGTLNTVHSRRCIGRMADARCPHYFEFKECYQCGTQNDITSRQCRECDCELIDPNAKLKLIEKQYAFKVKKAKYFITMMRDGSSDCVINCHYTLEHDEYQVERYCLTNNKSKNIAYAKFFRVHVLNASEYYKDLICLPRERDKKLESRLYDMLRSPNMKTPHTLICTQGEHDYIIKSKLFD